MRRQDPERIGELAREAGVPRIVASLLLARGIGGVRDAHEHLAPDLMKLHDPALLPGMSVAGPRIARSIRDRETILVHGDYDVDGITGTALLVRLLELLGAAVAWHVPDRFRDGYAFGPHSIERARAVGAKLVISVDNGTSSRETIGELLDLGIDTIVTDHHEPPHGELPPAVAIVNPKLADSTYPFRELCGGAVAFKLAWGLCQAVSESERVAPRLRDYLLDAMGYVAIATVCDVVPMRGENRILARFGLKALERTPTVGLAALLRAAGLAGRKLVAEDVGFQIGPRLNAAGRLGSAATAVELLLARERSRADELAAELEEKNEQRKTIEKALYAEARREAERFADRERWPVMVLAGQGWHQGVVGIVAARMVEDYERPAIVIGLAGEEGRGSARSIAGFSVLEAMHGGAAHFSRYGGHEQAAGCELAAGAIDLVRDAVCARARELLAGKRWPEREILIDDAIALGEVSRGLMEELDRLEPFGATNEKPVLLTTDVRLAEPPRVVGNDRTHLVLQVRSGADVLKAMAFGMAARLPELVMGRPLHLVHTPRWNTFRGETSLELLLHDFRTGASPECGTALA
jgi:single-stranded-DNA-specific exonuclease